VPQAAAAGPVSAAVSFLMQVIPAKVYSSEDIQSEANLQKCQGSLKHLYQLLRKYETAHGSLPKAAFYPDQPLTGEDSLYVQLGEEARPFLLCPSAGPDFAKLGWPNYIWNDALGGQKLAAIAKPEETWLLMDFVAPHEWLVSAGYAGHRGGVNVLFADGTVRWMPIAEAKGKFSFIR
jgi:prepilin-type processing-associated H-X9-DG protein